MLNPCKKSLSKCFNIAFSSLVNNDQIRSQLSRFIIWLNRDNADLINRLWNGSKAHCDVFTWKTRSRTKWQSTIDAMTWVIDEPNSLSVWYAIHWRLSLRLANYDCVLRIHSSSNERFPFSFQNIRLYLLNRMAIIFAHICNYSEPRIRHGNANHVNIEDWSCASINFPNPSSSSSLAINYRNAPKAMLPHSTTRSREWRAECTGQCLYITWIKQMQAQNIQWSHVSKWILIRFGWVNREKNLSLVTLTSALYLTSRCPPQLQRCWYDTWRSGDLVQTIPFPMLDPKTSLEQKLSVGPSGTQLSYNWIFSSKKVHFKMLSASVSNFISVSLL